MSQPNSLGQGAPAAPIGAHQLQRPARTANFAPLCGKSALASVVSVASVASCKNPGGERRGHVLGFGVCAGAAFRSSTFRGEISCPAHPEDRTAAAASRAGHASVVPPTTLDPCGDKKSDGLGTEAARERSADREARHGENAERRPSRAAPRAVPRCARQIQESAGRSLRRPDRNTTDTRDQNRRRNHLRGAGRASCRPPIPMFLRCTRSDCLQFGFAQVIVRCAHRFQQLGL